MTSSSWRVACILFERSGSEEVEEDWVGAQSQGQNALGRWECSEPLVARLIHCTTILEYLSPKLKGADGTLLTWIGTRTAVNSVTIWLCEGSGTVGRVRISELSNSIFMPSTQQMADAFPSGISLRQSPSVWEHS